MELPAELMAMLAKFNLMQNPKIKPGYGKTIPMPRKEFPDYEYQAYPRMMHEEFTKEYLEFWRSKNSYLDAGTNKTCYNSASPKIGSNQPLRANEDDVERGYANAIGDPVIVRNSHEEREILERRGLIAKQSKAKVATVQIEADAAELAALRAENAKLKKAAGQPEAAPKRRGRPPRAKDSDTVTVEELPG